MKKWLSILLSFVINLVFVIPFVLSAMNVLFRTRSYNDYSDYFLFVMSAIGVIIAIAGNVVLYKVSKLSAITGISVTLLSFTVSIFAALALRYILIFI